MVLFGSRGCGRLAAASRRLHDDRDVVTLHNDRHVVKHEITIVM
ncbi:hypothetical protein [Paracraurococcus ruber]|nr:hypothetical protein [Paracraurococcus ruber]